MASEHDEAREANAGKEPPRLTRANLALLRRAARERWGVPDELKTEAMLQVAKILATATKARTKLAAVKALIEFDKVDQRDRVIDLAHDKFDHQAHPPEQPEDDYVIDLGPEPGTEADPPHPAA